MRREDSTKKLQENGGAAGATSAKTAQAKPVTPRMRTIAPLIRDMVEEDSSLTRAGIALKLREQGFKIRRQDITPIIKAFGIPYTGKRSGPKKAASVLSSGDESTNLSKIHGIGDFFTFIREHSMMAVVATTLALALSEPRLIPYIVLLAALWMPLRRARPRSPWVSRRIGTAA